MNTKKHITQITKLKASIFFLNNEIQAMNNYEEIQSHLNEFAKFFTEQANPKNNRPNKNIIGFINYFEKVAAQKNRTKSKQKLQAKKSYKDYLSQYQILRARGLSYKKISDYSSQHFKIKVSKETIRTALKEVE